MPTPKLLKEDIVVSDDFIQKVSELYIKQRTETRFNYNSVDQSTLFKKHGFSSEALEKIITASSVATDIRREAGEKHKNVLTDIYRSDLGELLLTDYFEEKLPAEERFKIPFKNITNRELAGSPGRGIDAIGYREKDDKIQILLGEAKVSHQIKNPPDVVDYNQDSIYETQKKFHSNKDLLINRLSDYCRKLSAADAEKVGVAILLMKFNRNDHYDIIFGCSLIRDVSCVKINEDYGKFYTQKTDFDPFEVSFCIMSFDKGITDTIDLFYEKVQELCSRDK